MKEEHRSKFIVHRNEWYRCPELMAARNLRMAPSFNPLSMTGIGGLVSLTHELRARLGEGSHTMVELGSYGGESAVVFASSGVFDRVHCIDLWRDPACEGLCEYRTRGYRVSGKLQMHQACMYEKAEDFADGSVDFVYLDADHSYESTVKAIEIWRPKLRKGGCFGGHDWNEVSWPGVIQGVNECFDGAPPMLFEDTSWLHQLP